MTPKTTQSELTVEDLVRGFRTYVAAASAWLYRDPKLTKWDQQQRRNLSNVVAALDKLAARQADIAADVLRSVFVDQVVIALNKKDGNGTRGNPDHPVRHTVVRGGGRRGAEVPMRVPNEWYRAESLFRDEDPVVQGLRVGYWVYTHLARGRAQELDRHRAAALSEAASRLRRGRGVNATRIKVGPIAAALVRDLLDDPSCVGRLRAAQAEQLYASMEAFVAESGRRLRQRHPDRHGVEDADADAHYFGAFRSTSPASGAADFIAAAVGGDDRLEHEIADLDGRLPSVWSAAAVGRSSVNDPVDAEMAMLASISKLTLGVDLANGRATELPTD